ncbi:hypothetical protein PGB90_005449 [Kerria lacca]
MFKVILSNTKNIDKSLTYRFLLPWLGNGLLTSSGSKWHSHRKLITPAFHFKILDIFLEVFVEKCDILIKRLDKECDKEEFDVYPYITQCALDVICETAMGVPVYAQNETKSEYVKAIYEISELTVLRARKPWLWYTPIFKFSDDGKKYFESLNILHSFSRKVIQDRKQYLSKEMTQKLSDTDEIGTKKRLAFLDLLLEAAADGDVLTDEEIREEVDTFMFEGHDTTTASICWIIYLLGAYPHHQKKVVEELNTIFGDSDRVVKMQDLNEMKYLERIIKDALRLFPSVPFIGRKLKEKTTIGNYILPEGAHLIIHLYHIHRCSDQFPDPEKFNPDNFLPENILKRHPYSYVPFSAGPRNCIGQKFALIEEKIILSQILRNYRIESTKKFEEMSLISELVLRPLNGIQIKITRRIK